MHLTPILTTYYIFFVPACGVLTSLELLVVIFIKQRQKKVLCILAVSGTVFSVGVDYHRHDAYWLVIAVSGPATYCRSIRDRLLICSRHHHKKHKPYFKFHWAWKCPSQKELSHNSPHLDDYQLMSRPCPLQVCPINASLYNNVTTDSGFRILDNNRQATHCPSRSKILEWNENSSSDIM